MCDDPAAAKQCVGVSIYAKGKKINMLWYIEDVVAITSGLATCLFNQVRVVYGSRDKE